MLREPEAMQELRELTTAKRGPIADGSRVADPHWVGCTAVVCCVRQNEIVCANAGDSRAVLCRSGKAVPLSEDHKPTRPGEEARIRHAGGSVRQYPSGEWR